MTWAVIWAHIDKYTRSKTHCAENLGEMRYVQLPIHSSQSFTKHSPKPMMLTFAI